LNASGSALIYSTFLGGSNIGDEGNGIVIDLNGNAFITGRTDSNDFPVFNPPQNVFAGSTGDAFITKLNASGNSLIYSTFFGGSDFDFGQAIATDNNGNAYVIGSTSSNNFPTSNPIQPNSGLGSCGIGQSSCSDLFIVKLADVGLQFSSATLNVNEGDGSLTITVIRSGQIDLPVSIDYSTNNDVAIAGQDYIGVSGTLNFAAGETSKSFTIQIIDDSIFESTETFNVALSNPIGASLVIPSNALISIAENEVGLTLQNFIH
jgi:hypothetical protein